MPPRWLATAVPQCRRRECKCGCALSHAIITDRNAVPQDTREKLELLVGKYLGPRTS